MVEYIAVGPTDKRFTNVSSFLRPAGIIVAAALVLLLLAMRFPSFLVNALAFHPSRGAPASIEHLPGIEEIRLTAPDGVPLQAFLRRHPTANRIVVFFHGNAGNAYGRLQDVLELSEATASSVLLLSYRGYGLSEGAPDEHGVYLDGAAALRYARNVLGYSEAQIFLLGRSLGSAVAVHIAQDRNLAGLILVSPFASGRAMARDMGLGWLAWIAGRPFDSIEKIKKIHAPLLVIHGDAAGIIPIGQGRQLFAACPSVQKQFVVVPGAGHNDITAVAGPDYWAWMRDFMDDAPNSRLIGSSR